MEIRELNCQELAQGSDAGQRQPGRPRKPVADDDLVWEHIHLASLTFSITKAALAAFGTTSCLSQRLVCIHGKQIAYQQCLSLIGTLA